MHHGQSRGNKRRKRTKIGDYINFAEIGGICNMHHWLRGMEEPDSKYLYYYYLLLLLSLLLHGSSVKSKPNDLSHIYILFLIISF